ncbi:MAG: hypothetical protein ACLP6E_12420 [Acidimicrobiales bacterium]
MTDGSTMSAGDANGQEISRDDRNNGVRLGRRGLMWGAAAAGAGAVASLAAADPAGAANGGSVILGETNKATATTLITSKKATAFEASYTGTDEIAVGVFGTSTTGYGVTGQTTGFNAGVGGVATGEGASGVYGEASGTNGYGVYALATGTGGISLYVDGNATVTGTLSKGGGSFKIDHPLDPTGKYLYHSFVESPDMMNVYNGTVVLGIDGGATVELPEWFEALNRDFRYQLTAIGKPAPELHVSEEVADGRFSIAGGKAGQKVSWQVTGIRQDAWANANRIPIEVEKAPEDQGRYLHPDLFGGEAISEITRGRPTLRPTKEGVSAH